MQPYWGADFEQSFGLASFGYQAPLFPMEPALAGAFILTENLTMSRKRISGHDLSWIITQDLEEVGSPKGLILAIIPDGSVSWRAVVGNRSRKYFGPALQRKLDAIEKRLQSVYVLED